MKKLILIDGSNIMMRAAFGGDLEPERAVPIATGLIERAARQMAATHLIVALDSPSPSWRKTEFPEYKATRTRDTAPWLRAGFEEWTRRGWFVEALAGFEADDIIATIAQRAAKWYPVVAVSQDSDLLVLTALEFVTVLRPMDGGKFKPVSVTDVCGKYQIASPLLLTDFKALTGETGDNIPGVPGIGPMRAAKLLAAYGTLDAIIAAGTEKKCKDSTTVATHETTARLAFKLVSLRCDAPINPINPKHCLFNS